MKRIYLDNAATTRVDSLVAEKVNEFFVDSYGNASSQHSVGRKAGEALRKAREEIAGFVAPLDSLRHQTGQGDIVFTSGGTESNNLALRGLAKANPGERHIVTTAIEHPSVLETCRLLEKDGYEVDYIGVGADGIVSVSDVEKKIRKDTLVVSVMHVNNEIGTVQPVEEIGAVCRRKKVYFHCDAVQGFGKVELDIAKVDLMSVSGHKIGAPKGVGFLYVKKGVKISPILTGGGQEGGLRSGTENVAGIVGFATAVEKIDNREWKIEKMMMRESRDKIVDGLLKIDGARINGSLKKRVYNNINVSFYGVEGESLMLMLDREGIFVSTGSACASTKLEESYVLRAIGVENLYIHGSLRLTLGEDVVGNEDFVVGKIARAVEKLRSISPFKFSDENLGGLTLSDGSSVLQKDVSHSSNVDGSATPGVGVSKDKTLKLNLEDENER